MSSPERSRPAPRAEEAPVPPPQLGRRLTRRDRVRAALSSPETLRDLILVQELLEPPVAMRDRSRLSR